MSVGDAQLIDAQTTQTLWAERWSYFAGPHPTLFVTPKHRRVFQAYAARMGERNYCSLAVKARVARLQITGWDGPDADQAQQVWEDSRGPQRQDRMARWALGYGRAWLVVDPVERVIIPNKPTLVGGVESVDDPDEWRVVGKRWTGVDEQGKNVLRVVLWYADRHETYEKRDGSEWTLIEESPGTGIVPGVDLNPFGDGPVLMDTLGPAADRINKIGANKMVAAEFAAFAQWVFLTRQEFAPGDVEASPGEALIIDPGEEDWKAAVHQMQYTPLDNYDKSKDSEVDDLMSLAALPRHMRVNPGAPPSGDAIKADEGPLIEDVEDHQREMGEALSEAMSLLDIDAAPLWKDPTPHDDLGQAQEFSLLAPQIGWEDAGRLVFGWDDDLVAEIRLRQTPIAGNPTGADLLAQAEE